MDYLKKDKQIGIRMSDDTSNNLDKIRKEYDISATDALFKSVHNQFIEAKDILMGYVPVKTIIEEKTSKSNLKNFRISEVEMDEIEYLMRAYNLSQAGALRYSIDQEAEEIAFTLTAKSNSTNSDSGTEITSGPENMFTNGATYLSSATSRIST